MIDARLKGKIAALLSKTIAAGCTEAEAIAAAEMAAKLMAEHGLDHSDISMDEASAGEPTSRPGWRTKLASHIAWCTNCAAIVVIHRRDGNQIIFIGATPGPDIAVYLRTICVRAVDRAVREFKKGPIYSARRNVKTKRKAVEDFIAGMVARLCQRLSEKFAPVRDDKALQIAKGALEKRFPDNQEHKAPPRKVRFDAAISAGWRSGAEVTLNDGVPASQRKALA